LRALGLVLLLLGSTLPARAFQKVTVEICDPGTLFLFSEASWPPGDYSVEIFRVPDPTPENPQAIPESLGSATAGRTGRLYLRAALPLPANAGLRAIVRDSQGKAVAVSDFSTGPRATLQRSGAESEAAAVFEVRSPTPLAPLTDLTLVEVERRRLLRLNDRGEREEIPEVTRTHAVSPLKEIPSTACEGPESNRKLAVALLPGDRLKGTGVRLTGLRDLFGNAVVAEGELPPIPAPKGKEDALFYTRLQAERAKGSPETLALDLKLQPALRLRGAWLFRPELTASISRNLPPSTNSIRAAALFSRTEIVRRGLLATSTVSLGPSIEADRGFDRINGLLDLRWKPGLSNLYHPRENQRNEIAAKLAVSPQEAALPLTGWGLEGWIGLEAGRSLRRQSLVNAGPYDILRLRPALHGFYEIGPVTLDVASSLRYLGTTESAPGRVSGFRPCTEASLSWAFDPAKHLTLAAVYKNGSEPPTFVKVDKVSVGIVAKY